MFSRECGFRCPNSVFLLHIQPPMRTVPDHIPRPDYASHPDGKYP